MILKYIILVILFYTSLLSSNHLVDETSPYLLQHKDNPVDWYPWGHDAFVKAKDENKFMFLSIGYSTCHWCHVMAEESFEDKQVAKLLNDSYISIKVDREQYPHIDKYYQKIYHILNKKGGGWPLTIILTSDMKPIYAGTYVPKYSGYGSLGLVKILNNLKNKDKKKLNKFGQSILNILEQNKEVINSQNIDKDIEEKTIKQFINYYDFKYKGFSKHPKFPHASSIDILLDLYKITNNSNAFNMAIDSLKSMAKGGIYDQISGGFYRYSVDEKWQIPHFEKMLYTNAELIEVYTKAYKLTKNSLFKNIVIETIQEIDKRFLQNGVYKSASNADSKNFHGENEEGFYFIYDYDSIYEYLQNKKVKNIKNSLHHFGIMEDGNIDGDYCNPYIADNTKINISKIKEYLAKYREKKEYPFIDNKINTAWNALYIEAKLKASTFDKRYLDEALKSLDSLLKMMYIDGVLYHQSIYRKIPTQQALLEDYSFLISTLFQAYQLTLDEKYFKLFDKFVEESINKFYKNGKWLDSNDGFISYASLDDNAYKNALANLFNNLILYSTVNADIKILDIVKKSIKSFSVELNKYPSYYPTALKTLLLDKYPPIFIKSIKNNLNSIDLATIKYPYIYKKVYDTNNYLGCASNSCFSYSKDFSDIKSDIELKLIVK